MNLVDKILVRAVSSSKTAYNYLIAPTFAAMGKLLSRISTIDYRTINYTSVNNMYGDDDLSSCPLFKGGYINFGYWQGMSPSGVLTEDDRIQSEKNLYHQIFNRASLNSSDNGLEVGSGLGFGCALANTEYHVKKFTGLDLSSRQLTRAKEIHEPLLKTTDRIQFVQGSAENMPLASNSFSKVVSVEAAQHFRNVDAFLSEAHRVLTPDGKLAITTFFAPSQSAVDQLKELIPTIRDGIDNVVSIDHISSSLKKLGFKTITCESIGEHVWPGFDRWIGQTELRDTWNKNWLKAFKENLIDYYIITATK
jgi:ubiquinone/menaquinone biosynthesis C-methylase UbiE